MTNKYRVLLHKIYGDNHDSFEIEDIKDVKKSWEGRKMIVASNEDGTETHFDTSKYRLMQIIKL